VLCGERIDEKNETLFGWIKASALEANARLLGRRDDVPRLIAAFDIATSSSLGESFPNVIGEAMACGVPCVVTDVGDSAMIVGDTGRIAPPQNPQALAQAWRELLALEAEERMRMGQAARARVQEHFDLAMIVKRYEEFYESLVQC
jgi:glycosyltransferase involved in cell wall biosynthesis